MNVSLDACGSAEASHPGGGKGGSDGEGVQIRRISRAVLPAVGQCTLEVSVEGLWRGPSPLYSVPLDWPR